MHTSTGRDLVLVGMLLVAAGCQAPPSQETPNANAQCTGPAMASPAGPNCTPGGLHDLWRLHDARTRRSSSADPNWQNGNGDARPIHKGQTFELATLEGPGFIRHIWFTFYGSDPKLPRALVLRIYWDGRDEPSVESPIGDFFAVGHGAFRLVNSLPVSVTSDAKAYNCYWPMPFAKSARITISNDSDVHDAGVFWYIDYQTVPSLPPETPYFHAQYRQEYPLVMGRDYLILDAVGRGHYVGTVQSAQFRTPSWFGEGDDRFYIDGETEPSLRGTGTEDYFCDAWGYRLVDRPFYGVTLLDGYDVGDRVTTYRWHIMDPVHFKKSLKVTIEHKGVMFDSNGKRISGFMERQDLMSSVAFWYQTGVAKRFAEIPPLAKRVVPTTSIQLEKSLDRMKQHVEPPGTNMVEQKSHIYSDNHQVLVTFAAPGGKLVVPFTLDEPVNGLASLKLTKSFDYGVWKVSLDGAVIKGLEAVDLYAPTVISQEFKVGSVDLAQGEHFLTFECVGKNPQSKSYYLGVDAMFIEHIKPYTVPAQAAAQK
jgi:hypothetical protein